MQEQLWHTLTNAYASLPPFLIFYGEKGIGKSALAKQFAAHVMNEELHTLENGARQNYRYINFNDEEIKLEIVPVIQDFLSHKYEQYKVLILDNADNLNIHAYNSLLKTFEKEYEKTFVILIVHNIHKFPQTLRSRFFEIEVSTPTLSHPLAPYVQGNVSLLKWVEQEGGQNFIDYLKNLMIMENITSEHESFIQKYKEHYSSVLTLIKNMLYTNQNAFAFERLNQFMIRADHTHIPTESHLLMGFLLSKS